MSEQQPHGRIWEMVDNLAKALKWAGQYAVAGAPSIEIKPRSKPVNGLIDDLLVDVIVTVPRTPVGTTNPILGRSIDEEEWMNEDFPIKIGKRAFCDMGWGNLQLATVVGHRLTTARATGSTSVNELSEYQVVLHDEEGRTMWVRTDAVSTDVARLAKEIMDAEDAT